MVLCCWFDFIISFVTFSVFLVEKSNQIAGARQMIRPPEQQNKVNKPLNVNSNNN